MEEHTFVDADSIRAAWKKGAKVAFEIEKQSVLDALPDTYRARFRQIGFAEERRPVQILGPYDVPPGPLRKQWMAEFKKFKEQRRNLAELPYLTFFYAAPHNTPDEDSVALTPSVLSFSEGSAQDWDSIPKSIQTKIINGLTLTDDDNMWMEALRKMENALQHPGELPWKMLDDIDQFVLTQNPPRPHLAAETRGADGLIKAEANRESPSIPCGAGLLDHDDKTVPSAAGTEDKASSGNVLNEKTTKDSPHKRKRSQSTGVPSNKIAKSRILADGSIVPHKPPKKVGNIYAIPCGRRRAGYSWDSQRGVWKPESGKDVPQEKRTGPKTTTSPPGEESQQQQLTKNHEPAPNEASLDERSKVERLKRDLETACRQGKDRKRESAGKTLRSLRNVRWSPKVQESEAVAVIKKFYDDPSLAPLAHKVIHAWQADSRVQPWKTAVKERNVEDLRKGLKKFCDFALDSTKGRFANKMTKELIERLRLPGLVLETLKLLRERKLDLDSFGPELALLEDLTEAEVGEVSCVV